MSSIILEAKSLTKEYKQTLALDHINLQIKKGKIYGFIGQNGAGKTTFLRLVTGLAFPTSGTLSLWGNSGTEELQKQRKRIGSMIETPALFPSMTAYQNMEVQRIQRGIPDKSVIKRTLDMVGLQDTGKKSVRNFSLGMRQRLGIAIALLNTPELLILDEPTAGLDPMGRDVLLSQIVDYHRQRNNTVLLVSHSMEDIARIADRVLVIDDGKVAMFEKTDRVFAQSARLSQMGLRVPQITKIMTMLREKGYPVSSGVLTVEQGVQEILRILGREEESRGQ